TCHECRDTAPATAMLSRQSRVHRLDYHTRPRLKEDIDKGRLIALVGLALLGFPKLLPRMTPRAYRARPPPRRSERVARTAAQLRRPSSILKTSSIRRGTACARGR